MSSLILSLNFSIDFERILIALDEISNPRKAKPLLKVVICDFSGLNSSCNWDVKKALTVSIASLACVLDWHTTTKSSAYRTKRNP